MEKTKLYEIIDANKLPFEKISDDIWDHPELCFQEVYSTELQKTYMVNAGFKVTSPFCGLDTSFVAECGSGKPVIAILGENDALANQSQCADVPEPRPEKEGGNGHACGHNLIGTGGMEAACALKQLLDGGKLSGTVRYIACPAEEGGGGKVILARRGAFDDVDAALSWHPGSDNALNNTGLACCNVNFRFVGKAAHASGEPWNGRSALDALELMTTGIQYLREHMTPDSRIHYAITNTGGTAPNVVQREAELLVCVRAQSNHYMADLYRRVCKVAEGAAIMTETELDSIKIESAYANFLRNDTMDDLVIRNVKEQLPIEYSSEELAYAEKFQKKGNLPDAPDPICKYFDDNKYKPSRGSTDVADVSWIVPISQPRIACAAAGSVGHGWTTTAQGKSSIAHKGMHVAAKVMAGCVYDLLTNPDLLVAAKDDHMKALQGKSYFSLMQVD